ncbi:helix-turn-helix domain-containing protein [Streptomyces reniochalinae]|nr:helix-turn-helix transcriptional regulator [Streptomyces reniochalinae]
MPSTADQAALTRLADLVARRRTELGLTQIATAREAGLTKTTYRQVEAGHSVRDSTYGKLEPALGWAAGSCSEVLQGGDPVVISPSVNGAVVTSVAVENLDDNDVGQAVQNAAIAVTDLPAPDIRKLTQRVLEELRRAGKLPEIDED